MVRENENEESGKSQGILKASMSGNPVLTVLLSPAMCVSKTGGMKQTRLCLSELCSRESHWLK